MDFSVGDFAENLIAQEKGKGGVQPPTLTPDPSVYSADVGAQAPDISNVQVPHDFVSNLVEGKAPEAPQAPIQPPSPQPVAEDTELRSLIQELKDVLIEVRQTLTEMTAVGSLGAGSSPPEKKKEDDDDPVEAVLRKVRRKRTK